MSKRSNSKKEDKFYRLYYKTMVNGGCSRVPDPESEWDSGDFWSEHTLLSIHKSPVTPYSGIRNEYATVDFVPVVGQIVYVVHAQWSTGNSFGHESGAYHEIISAYTNKDYAEEDYKLLKSANKIESILLKNGSSFCVPWIGYFESLDWLNNDEMMVQP